MKQILRIRERYALSKIYSSLLVVATIMCLYAHAQRPEPSGPVPLGFSPGNIVGLVPDDSLPAWFWEVELNVMNHPNGQPTVKLREYESSKLLVLDFWATYCTPCVKSLDKWNDMQSGFGDEVAVVGIHLYHYNHAVEPFVRKMEWKLPIALGNKADTLLNELFYAQHRFGQVWIKDGKLLAIPKNKAVTEELVAAVIAGKQVDIEMEESLTYFDPALKQTDN